MPATVYQVLSELTNVSATDSPGHPIHKQIEPMRTARQHAHMTQTRNHRNLWLLVVGLALRDWRESSDRLP
jgi:hypothetical protein